MGRSSIARISRRNVRIPIDGVELEGELGMPELCRSLVLFVHGSGSGRLSPRNQLVDATLRERGIATLLFDLLTELEERVARLPVRALWKSEKKQDGEQMRAAAEVIIFRAGDGKAVTGRFDRRRV